jgi:hypothetical protein
MSRHLLRIAVAALTVAATATLPAAPAHADGQFGCLYEVWTWPGGFMADLSITNHGPDITGWTARWTFQEPTVNLSTWQAVMSIADNKAVASNLSYNGAVLTGQTVSFGWSATAKATSVPDDITINGVPC